MQGSRPNNRDEEACRKLTVGIHLESFAHPPICYFTRRSVFVSICMKFHTAYDSFLDGFFKKLSYKIAMSGQAWGVVRG